jgi:hypothetical protein
MSAAHLQCVEKLISHAQGFLRTVQRNEAPDLELFDSTQAQLFEELKALGPVQIASPYMPQVRTRMAHLEFLNREMIMVIKKLLGDTQSKLQSSSTNRRAMTGYQRSLFGRASRGKGMWRGKA